MIADRAANWFGLKRKLIEGDGHTFLSLDFLDGPFLMGKAMTRFKMSPHQRKLIRYTTMSISLKCQKSVSVINDIFLNRNSAV